jgi:hypothetical protein
VQLDGYAALAEVADDRALDAGVDHGNPLGRTGCELSGWRTRGWQHDKLVRSHFSGEVAAAHRRLGGDQLPRPSFGDRRREEAALHRALVADVTDECAGVEVGDPRDPAVDQPREPTALGAGCVLAVDAGAHDRGAGMDPV